MRAMQNKVRKLVDIQWLKAWEQWVKHTMQCL
jgi:hypothetical protein